MYITVLFGGIGGERGVSLASGLRVCEALLQAGHRVEAFDIREAPDCDLLCRLAEADAVFLALHGGDGEGGRLQAALDAAGITHYTGSDALGAASAMNKQTAKRIVTRAGVPVAEDVLWQVGTPPPELHFPAIVKPLLGGSSVGLYTARESSDLIPPTEPMLAEALLTGREYTVGLLDGQALPVVEIRPRGGIYDYRHKYTAGATEELCPAPLEPTKAALLQQWATTAFEALALRDFARMDFKENDAGTPCFLEANTLPGLTATSLLPLAAATAGLDFPTLCTRMAELAAGRKNQKSK